MKTVDMTLAVACGVLLSACGGEPTNPGADVTLPSVEATGSPTPSIGGEPDLNERGNMEAAVGQELTLPDGGTVVIDKVEAMPLPCPTDTEYSQATPQHGAFVRLDLRVATAPVGTAGVNVQPGVSSYNFQYIQGNGVTFSADMGTFGAYSCLPQEQMFPSGGLGPGQRFVGSMVLDVPETTGTLIYFPGGSPGSEVGYEFELTG